MGPHAFAQLTLDVDVSRSGSLTISHTMVVFDLTAEQYPPLSFPAYFLATEPAAEESPMGFTVESSYENWTVTVTFSGLYNERANAMLPPEQLEYSSNGGNSWHAFALGGNTILQGLGTQSFPTPHPFALRLRLMGDEEPGDYTGTLTFSLVHQ